MPSAISKSVGREEGSGLWRQQTWVQILNILFTSDVTLRKISSVLSFNMKVRVPALEGCDRTMSNVSCH